MAEPVVVIAKAKVRPDARGEWRAAATCIAEPPSIEAIDGGTRWQLK